MGIIRLEDIKKTFGKKGNSVEVLKGISININEGEMVAITGTSGSGKSTLLNIIGCIDTPTSGSFYFDNKPINGLTSKELSQIRNSSIGFVLQDFALIEEYTVKKNIMLPLVYSKNKLSKSSYIKQVDLLLEKLNILNKKDEITRNLSGGQKKRVAIARALVTSPKVILADEPTGALDKKNSLDIINLLKDLNNTGVTMIIVTHDMEIASYCNRIINIEDGVVVNI